MGTTELKRYSYWSMILRVSLDFCTGIDGNSILIIKEIQELNNTIKHLTMHLDLTLFWKGGGCSFGLIHLDPSIVTAIGDIRN